MLMVTGVSDPGTMGSITLNLKGGEHDGCGGNAEEKEEEEKEEAEEEEEEAAALFMVILKQRQTYRKGTGTRYMLQRHASRSLVPPIRPHLQMAPSI